MAVNYMKNLNRETSKELADLITDKEGWVEVPVDEYSSVMAMTLNTFLEYCDAREEMVRFTKENTPVGELLSRGVYTRDGIKSLCTIVPKGDGNVDFTYMDLPAGVGSWEQKEDNIDVSVDISFLSEEEIQDSIRMGSVKLYEPDPDEYRTEDYFETMRLHEMLKIRSILEECEKKKDCKVYRTIDFDYTYGPEAAAAMREKPFTEFNSEEFRTLSDCIEKEHLVFTHDEDKVIVFMSSSFFWELENEISSKESIRT